mmetsp:Transcript_32030/g.47301  ORF Transcript_32030/g.47301 Transcript_32030/m.47301 type:complete len:109 (+) Transcript_32030:1503-1829(+)
MMDTIVTMRYTDAWFVIARKREKTRPMLSHASHPTYSRLLIVLPVDSRKYRNKKKISSPSRKQTEAGVRRPTRTPPRTGPKSHEKRSGPELLLDKGGSSFICTCPSGE